MNPGLPELPISKTRALKWHSLWIKWGITAFGLFVLFFIVQWVLGWLVVYGLYRFFSGSANDLTGLNPYLLKAIGWAVALLVVYLICARRAKFLKRWRVLGFLPVVFNLGFYFLTKDLYFRFSDGAPLQWAAITDQGVIYYTKPGFGPDGKVLVRVTAENIKRFKNVGSEMSAVDPERVEWFSPNTGEASIYYYKSPSGDFEFYNRWAHHPGNGQELKPVTVEVRAEYEAWQKERLGRESRIKAEQVQIEEKKAADVARETRLTELRALFSPIVTDPKVLNIALVVVCESKSADCDRVSQRLLSGLQSAAPNVVFLPDYCTPDFTEKGYFEKAYQGDVSVVKEIDGFSPIDYLLLCKVNVVTTSRSAGQDLFTCRIDLGFLLLDKDGRQANRGNFEVAGPGLSEALALNRGIELLTERHSTEFLTGVTSKAPQK
jgi:hypothetical protein